MKSKIHNTFLTWNWPLILILALLGIALGLRVWGIWFGLPHIFHNDEANEVVRALQLGTGQFNFERLGKGGYFYILFLEYGFLFVALMVSGLISSASEFGEYYISNPTAFFLIGRATTALIGTFSIYLVYRIGQTAYSTVAAIFAAGILTFNVLHADLSHFVTVDVPMTCLAIASLFFAIKMATENASRNYWLAAFLAALATSTKMPAVLLVIPLLVAHCYFTRRNGGKAHQYLISKLLWQAIAIFVVTYVIFSPGIVVYFQEVFWKVLGKFVVDSGSALSGPRLVSDPRSMFADTNLFVFYLDAIIDSMTLPVFMVCTAGAAYAIWKREAVDTILISFIVAVYVTVSIATDGLQFFPRYILPVLPAMALLGGRLLGDIVELMPSAKKSVAALALSIVLASIPATRIIAANHLMSQKDTREIGKEWIETNLEAGSKVFIEGSRTFPYESTVPLQNSAENIRANIAEYRKNEPGKAKFLQMTLNAKSGKTFDLITVQPHNVQELTDYKDNGVQYFVLRPDRYEGSRQRYEWPKLVNDILADPDVVLVQRIEPDPRSRPGPLIEVYRVNSNVDAETPAE